MIDNLTKHQKAIIERCLARPIDVKPGTGKTGEFFRRQIEMAEHGEYKPIVIVNFKPKKKDR